MLFPAEYPSPERPTRSTRCWRGCVRTRTSNMPASRGRGCSSAKKSPSERLSPRADAGRDARSRTSLDFVRSARGFCRRWAFRFLGGRGFHSVGQCKCASGGRASTEPPPRNSSARERGWPIIEWNSRKPQIQVQVAGVVEQLRNETLEHEPFPEVFVDYRQLLVLLQQRGTTAAAESDSAGCALDCHPHPRSSPSLSCPRSVKSCALSIPTWASTR